MTDRTLTPWRSLLLGFLLVSVLAPAVVTWWLWPPSDAPKVSEEFSTTFNLNHAQVTGVVVVVDGAARTSAEGVYALGDVNGRGAFTHTSVHDAQVLLDHLRGAEHPRTIDERPTVYAVFTDPPLGRVGMTEDQARASGRRVLRATKPMRSISRAKEMGETQGFVKVLVDADDDRLLGASVLGVRGDEVVNLFALAMSAGLTTAQFRRAVLVHPTVGELMPWVLAGLRPLDEA